MVVGTIVKSLVTRGDLVRRFGLWFIFAAVVVALAAASPAFRTPLNLENILEQNSLIGIVACGMAVMMISGGFDLSVGAIGASAAVAGAEVATKHGTFAGVLAGLAIGLVVGFANGLLIARVKINPFVATFAMSSIVSGLLFVQTNANSKQVPVNSLIVSAASNRVHGIPVVFLIFVALLIVVGLLLTRTKFGHYVYSVGGNAEASHLSGVPVKIVQASAFIIGGILAALAGLLLLGQTTVGQPGAASDWPLRAIAICVVGGVALTGGVGRIEDVLAATMLLGVIANGLNELNVSSYWQPAVTGVVIIAAVVLDQYNRIKQRSLSRAESGSSGGSDHMGVATADLTTANLTGTEVQTDEPAATAAGGRPHDVRQVTGTRQ